MKVGSLVERIEIANAAGNWIVANRRRLAPTFWVIAIMMPLVVFWIGPLLLQDSWVRDAKTAHASWIETNRIPGGRVMKPAEFLTGLRQLGPPPHLPDLSANGLDLRQVSFRPSKGGRSGAIHAGYANEDGCRISLWITPSRRTGVGALVEQHRGLAFSWYADGLQYVIVRAGMHRERFHVLAKSARATTIARESVMGSRRFALAASAMFGPPCTS
jgi:hypothetical protein